MTWDNLKVALAVSRMGSLSAAAHALEMDQSTVSRRLSVLEAELGTLLFLRSPSGLKATEAGTTALRLATEMEKRATELVEQVAAMASGPSGLVRLIGNPWTLLRLTETAVTQLFDTHPALDLRMIAGPHQHSLARGEAALALWFEFRPRDQAYAVPLTDVPYAAYIREDLDPARTGWVSFWFDDQPDVAPPRWLARHRHPEEALRLTSSDAIGLRAAIAAGVGKGLLPRCLGDGWPGLVAVPDPKGVTRTLHIHVHPDTAETARVKAVIDWLRMSATAAFHPPATDQ